MAIGAGIGALAGFAVYSAKVLLSKKTEWSWKDAAAHSLGGLAGGAVFPPLLAGLAAVGLPTTVAYVAAGGVAWGGIWTLAQDTASWALGRAKRLGTVKHYLISTAIGAVATALLLPFAARAIGPAGQFARHSGSIRAFLSPSTENLTANVLKSEAEFLVYGAFTETVAAGARAVGRNTLRAGAGTGMRQGTVEAATVTLTRTGQALDDPKPSSQLPSYLGEPLPEEAAPEEAAPEEAAPEEATAATETVPWFRQLGERLPNAIEEPAEPSLGLVEALSLAREQEE